MTHQPSRQSMTKNISSPSKSKHQYLINEVVVTEGRAVKLQQMCGKCMFEAKFMEFAQPIPVKKKKVKKATTAKKPLPTATDSTKEEVKLCLMELIASIEEGEKFDIILSSDKTKSAPILPAEKETIVDLPHVYEPASQVSAEISPTPLFDSKSMVDCMVDLTDNVQETSDIGREEEVVALVEKGDEEKVQLPPFPPLIEPHNKHLDFTQSNINEKVLLPVDLLHIPPSKELSMSTYSGGSCQFYSRWMSYFVEIKYSFRMMSAVMLQVFLNPWSAIWMSRGISRLPFKKRITS